MGGEHFPEVGVLAHVTPEVTNALYPDMADPLRHRQTKGAATDMVDLTPPRHIPTLPSALLEHVVTPTDP
jgi:hypothetical protein